MEKKIRKKHSVKYKAAQQKGNICPIGITCITLIGCGVLVMSMLSGVKKMTADSIR